MCVLKTRGCKMCGGNVLLDRAENGKYVFCIRCGAVYHEGLEQRHWTLSPELAVKTPAILTAVR